MSNIIENNVVKMTFDNKDFEKNISTSSKSIEELNEQLKFKDAKQGFKDIERYANSVNFDGLNKAIENINSVFTITGNLSKKIIDDIAGYFENKITSAVRIVKNNLSSITDINAGIKKYEQYTTAMSTLRANMTTIDNIQFEAQKSAGKISTDLEYIQQYMDKIMYYADETSYSFTDMVDSIAKYTASDVEMEKAASTIMGLANVAAVAGQNAATATQSMYQLAQSFGVGYVRYQDWMQAILSKNMVTKELKETLVQAAVGVTIDEDDLKKAGYGTKSNWADFFFTSDMLNQKWLTTGEVLVKGLSEYSKASDLILSNVEDIGEGVSVSKLLAWVEEYKKAGKTGKEAADDFAAALWNQNEEIEDASLLAEILDTLADKEYDLSLKAFQAAQQATNFHEAIEATKDAVGTRFLEIFTYFIGDLDQARKLWTGFANALYDIIALPLENTINGLEKWNTELSDVSDETGNLLTYYELFWKSIGDIFGAIGSFFNGFVEDIKKSFNLFETSQRGTVRTISIIKNYTFDFLVSVTNAVKNLADIMQNFLNSKFYKNLLKTFTNLFKTFLNIKNVIAKVFGSVFINFLKNLGEPLTMISTYLVKASESLESFSSKLAKSDRLNKFTNSIGKLTAKLTQLAGKVLEGLLKVLGKILDKLGQLVGPIFKKLSPIIDWLIDIIDDYLLPAIDELIDGPYSIGKAIDWLVDKIDIGIDKIKDFSESIFGISFEDAKEKIKDFAEFAYEKLGDKATGVFSVLKDYVKDSFGTNAPGTIGDLLDQIADANSVAEGAQSTIKWTGDALMRPINLILDIASTLLGKDLSGFGEAISIFIHSITDSFANITPNLFSFIEKVGGLLLDILGFVANLIFSIIKYTFGFSESTGFGLLDDIIYSIKVIFTSLVEAFAFLLKSIANIAPMMTPAIQAVIEWIGDVIVNIANIFKDSFKTLSNIESPEEFAHYIFGLVKILLAIFIFIKVFTIVDDLIFTFKKFGRSAKILSRSVLTVADGFAGVLDTIAGYGIPGMIKMCSILLFSIGYALAQVAKVGQMMADEKLREGVIMAFVGMIAMMTILTFLMKRLMKTQTGLIKSLGKFNMKYGISKEGDNDNINRSFAGVAAMLMGMAVAMIGISASVAILAKVSKQVGKENITEAIASITYLFIALGIFLKLAATSQSTEKEFLAKSKGVHYNNKSSGKFYKGVASSLMAFAVSMLLISPAIALLAHASKTAGKENFSAAVSSMVKILLVLGLMMALTVKFSNNTKFLSSAGIVLILGAVSKLLVTLAILISALGLGLVYLIDASDRADIFKLMDYFVAIIGILSAMIVLMTARSKSISIKADIAQLGIRIAKMMVITSILASLALVIAAIGGGIYVLVHLLEKYKDDQFIPDVVSKAVGIILLIVGTLSLMIYILAKSLKLNSGDWKTVLARVGAISILVLIISNLLVVIAGVATLLAWFCSFESIGKNIWKAVGILGAILGGLTVFVFLLSLIGVFLANKGNGKMGERSEDASTSLIKLAKAIVALALAMGVMVTIIIGTGYAMGKLEDHTKNGFIKGLLGVAAALGTLLLAALAFGVLSSIIAPGITILLGLLKVLIVTMLTIMGLTLVMAAYGDKIATWLENATPKVRKGFRALGYAMIAAVEGFNEALPKLLVAINDTVMIILAWISVNVSDWTYKLCVILAGILTGIANALNDESTELGAALAGILVALSNVVMTFLTEVLGEDIVTWCQDLVGVLGDILLLTIPVLGAYIISSEAKARRELEIDEREHQKQMYEMRRLGAIKYMEMLENLEKAENEMIAASELADPVARAQAQRRANENASYWSGKIGELQDNAEEIFSKYGVDVTQGASAQNVWWLDEDAGISQYNALIESRDWRQGFNWKYDRIADSHSSAWYKNLNPHSKQARKETGYTEMNTGNATVGTGGRKKNVTGETTGVGGAYTEYEQQKEAEEQGVKVGDFISLGVEEGADAEKTGSNIITQLFSGAGTTIKEKAELLVDYFKKATGLGTGDSSNILSSLTGGDTDIVRNLADNSIKVSYDDSATSAMFNNVDTTGYIADINDGYYQNMGSYDTGYGLDASYAMNQLDGMAVSTSASNEEVVDELKDLNENMSNYAEAIKEIKMILDTGVLIGAIAPDLDKYLGERAKNKNLRGNIT